MIDIFKQGKRDTVILLRKYGGTKENPKGIYKFVKKLKVRPGEEFTWKKKTYMPPSSANYLETHGNYCHFVDVDTSFGIPFLGGGSAAFNAQQIDAYVSGNILKDMASSFGTLWEQNKTLLLFAVGTGTGIGAFITVAIFMVGMR